MENKRIIKKAGIYFIGNLSSKLLASILVPIYAFFVSANDLGQFDYSQTILNIVNPIIFICIWEAILRYVLTEENENQKKRETATSAVFTIAMSVILGAGISVFYSIAIEDTKYMLYVIGLFISNGFSHVWQYYARALKRNKTYVLAGVLNTVVNFLSNIILICFLKMKLEALYLSGILGNIVALLLIEFKIGIIKHIKKENIDLKILGKMLKFSAPLVINNIATWLISGLGRIIIGNMIGKDSNGLYAFANKFSIIVTFIGTVLNMAVIEESILISREKDFEKQFSNNIQFTFNKFLTLITLVVPAMMVFYEIIQNTEYYEARVISPILLMYAVIMTMCTNIGAVFQAKNKTKYISIPTMIGSIIMVIFSITLVNKIGLMAVVIGQLLGGVIIMIARYKISRKIYKS